MNIPKNPTYAIVVYFFALVSGSVFSQPSPSLYDTDLLPKEFHKERREALRAKMPDSSVAFFFSNPVRNRSNDVYYSYSQNPNFYYLTGFREPGALLVVFKEMQDINNKDANEIIFVRGKNLLRERWTGERMGTDSVKTKLGFALAMTGEAFADFGIRLSNYKKVLFYPLADDVRDDEFDNSDLYSMIKQFRNKIFISKATTDTIMLAEIMASLRQVKLPQEIALLRKAVNITCAAHHELMKALEPGMNEYKAQAIVEYVFKQNGSEYPGYPSIVGSGENTCILHYETNRKKLEPKNLLLCDAGAEYHGYTADVTRTLPVDGKFSAEETVIYNIVLEAQMAGIAACKAGNEFREPHKAAMEIITKRLKETGIITEDKEVMNYFFHGTSHYLGLDVHDAGLYGKLEAGNVITVEPGIYIPAHSDCEPKWWNIGVRIEDDILITNGLPENLSSCVPKTVDEIEAVMKKESLFNLMKDVPK